MVRLGVHAGEYDLLARRLIKSSEHGMTRETGKWLKPETRLFVIGWEAIYLVAEHKHNSTASSWRRLFVIRETSATSHTMRLVLFEFG